MKLEIATDKDNESILKFYTSFLRKGLVDFKLDRGSDFFSYYKSISSDHRTYLLKDPYDHILATASFIFRDVLLNGRVEKMAFATDLRVSPTRKAIIEWTQHFLPVIENMQNEMDIQYFFSVLNLNEPHSLNAFVRPRQIKRPMPRYYLFRKFNIVTLHGQYPWAAKGVSSLRIRPGSEANFDALLAYLVKRSPYRLLSSIWDKQSFDDKMSRLQGFKLSDFLVAFDANEQVVGCLSMWNSQGLMDYLPLSYSLPAHNFRQFLKFFWLFGMTRRLTKPKRSTGDESPLNFRYLSNLHADNEDIFSTLLWEAFHRSEKDQFLMYAQIEKDFKISPPKDWISSTHKHALYSVLHPKIAMPEFLHPSVVLNPEIDPYII